MTVWEYVSANMVFMDDVQKQEIHKALLAEKAELWHNDRAIAVTEVTDDNTLHIMQASGDLNALLDMLDSAVLFAKSAGCVGIEVSGRKGWKRVLAKFGFIPDGDRMYRALNVQ